MPRDPGRMTRACGVRDHAADYASAGATVLGVSPDPVERIKAFHGGQGLNFTLCPTRTTGGRALRGVAGRTYLGVHRMTYVIHAEGRVAPVIVKVSPRTHDDVVLKALDDLAGAAA